MEQQEREPNTLSAAEVAEKLGKSRDWFYRNKRILVARGFPKEIISRRYSTSQVNNFLDGNKDNNKKNNKPDYIRERELYLLEKFKK